MSGQTHIELSARLAEIERRKAVVDADWTRKLTMLVGQCIADQRNGYDVLASASWDAVVEFWTACENGNQ